MNVSSTQPLSGDVKQPTPSSSEPSKDINALNLSIIGMSNELTNLKSMIDNLQNRPIVKREHEENEKCNWKQVKLKSH